MKIVEKYEFWQASFWFTLINQLNMQKGACSRNYKSSCNLPFVIKPFNENIFWSLWWKCILPRREIRKGVRSRLRTRADGTSWSNIAFEIFLWKTFFLFLKKHFKGSTFPVVPFLLVQLKDFKTLRSQFPVNPRPPPNWNPIQSPLLLSTTFWYAVKYSY